MKEGKGTPLPIGIREKEGCVNLSFDVPEDAICYLVLFEGEKEISRIELQSKNAVGTIRSIRLPKAVLENREYVLEIDGKVKLDSYALALTGREIWGEKKSEQRYEVKGKALLPQYDWESDQNLRLPDAEVVAYSLHVRGFTKDESSMVKHKGTFKGVEEKLPYIVELGINQLQLMPIYEFEERKDPINFWGYGKGYFFAPKSSYGVKDAVTELKDLVKACHRVNVEVVLEMPFAEDTPHTLIIDCLRHYHLEYHVDGFIVNSYFSPIYALQHDPLLNNAKIMERKEDFQVTMRRFLKSDEGMLMDVIRNIQQMDSLNYITSHNGFTLWDLVSYDSKHNEDNGEGNTDGPEYNYSWNCGAEGATRKKNVLALRMQQAKNAFALLLLSKGVPCILAGDEFCNSQKGNNNAYCQDNPVGWVNWEQSETAMHLCDAVKQLISLRKELHIGVHGDLGFDKSQSGVPIISFHGESAWQIQSENSSRQLGALYCATGKLEEGCFVAFNLHWMKHSFALPTLAKEQTWELQFSTSKLTEKMNVSKKAEKEDKQSGKTIVVMPRAIEIYNVKGL